METSNEKNILDLARSEEERKKARVYVEKIYAEDKKRYDKAYRIVRLLAMGGLWRGVDIAIMLVDKEINEVKP